MTATPRKALPIEQHASAILAKVDSHRVTLIIGATGCGKSTQVPKLLRQHLRRRVLCVQPRRMAVVAVATRVAEELDEPLGEGAVGYHIGAAKQAELDKTQLMFVTAGIFLEMLKFNGVASMALYGAVVIDEVHERSCENDVSLACLRQLALHAKELRTLKIVLMSATADISRYSDFVKPLCTDAGRPATYAIGESATVYNTTKRYLKDAIDLAAYDTPPKLEDFERHDRHVGAKLCRLIAKLVPQLVRRTIKEDGAGCTVLVFLATYSLIEEAHGLLDQVLGDHFPLYVLHSSVDMEDCMAALLGEDGAPARVVLASAVAESSITIKRVTHVVDSCRACEIHWTPGSGESSPHIVWVSQAQAKQRAGRTGRTNHGTVWQLVAPSWYHSFPDFELASLQLQLLRKEVLLLTCSGEKRLCDARKMLASCLDPPKVDAVTRAEEWLLANQLIERLPVLSRQQGARPTLQATRLGQLIDSLPVDVDSAKLVLLGAQHGLLDEAVILAVLRSTQPMALKREPNQQHAYEKLVARFGPVHAELDAFVEDELLANLAAYLSFQRWQGDPRRLRHVHNPAVDAQSELEGETVLLGSLKSRQELNGHRVLVGKYDPLRGRYAVTLESGEQIKVRRINLIEFEAEWCRERSLSHTSLLAVSRTVEHVMNTVVSAVVSNPPQLYSACTAVIMTVPDDPTRSSCLLAVSLLPACAPSPPQAAGVAPFSHTGCV